MRTRPADSSAPSAVNPRGGVFRFTKNVRDFVFARDVGEALQFAGACGGKIDGSACGELRLYGANAGDDITVKTTAGA